MKFTIDPGFIAEVVERYKRGLAELPYEWGAEYWGEEGGPPSEVARYLSPEAHCLGHVRSLIDQAFWASVEKVEGRHHSFEVVYCDNDLAASPFVFNRSIPCAASDLAKLSAAIPMTGAIGVWPDPSGALGIWGFEPEASTSSGPCLRIAALQPGTIIIGCGGQSYFKALLTAKTTGFVDQGSFKLLHQRLSG
jgi:hypothetical protein